MDNLTIADVGVERFNNDHQRLLFYVKEFNRLARRFQERPPEEDEWDQIEGIFPRLESYTVEHFGAEEEMMRHYDYPYLHEHLQQHANLIDYLSKMKTGILSRHEGSVASLESFLLEWLCTHINRDDFQYRGFIQAAETRDIIDKALFNEMISASQLYQVLQSGASDAVILDLRTETEQKEAIIPSSHLFACDHNLEDRTDTEPFKSCFSSHFDPQLFDREKRYFLVCRSGPRTEIALEYFLEAELKACELIGGIEEWKRQGYPITQMDDTTPKLR